MVDQEIRVIVSSGKTFRSDFSPAFSFFSFFFTQIDVTLLYVHVCVCFRLCSVFWTAEPQQIICEPDTNCNILPLLVIIKVGGDPFKNTFSKVMILCRTPNL